MQHVQQTLHDLISDMQFREIPLADNQKLLHSSHVEALISSALMKEGHVGNLVYFINDGIVSVFGTVESIEACLEIVRDVLENYKHVTVVSLRFNIQDKFGNS